MNKAAIIFAIVAIVMMYWMNHDDKSHEAEHLQEVKQEREQKEIDLQEQEKRLELHERQIKLYDNLAKTLERIQPARPVQQNEELQ